MTFYQVIRLLTALTLLTKESASQLAVCGQPVLSTRIIGGDVAPAGSWPWMVFVQISSSYCGGSLINNLWVLTAAHCVSGQGAADLMVLLGLSNRAESDPNQVSRTVAQIIVHPNYNSGTKDNDIALLRLSSPVIFTSYISPVCLAASDSSFYSGVNSWVTGWGVLQNTKFSAAPPDLMEVEIPVVGNRECNCDYGVGNITNNMICAGLPQGGKDACQGDSGGPMVSQQGGRWIQSGIVSFGFGCAETNTPGVYTRVSQYQNWINTQITSNQPGFITFTSSGFNSDLSVSCAGLAPEPVFCGQVPLNFTDSAGGSAVTPGEWPWIVSLQRHGQHVCGGTLVSEDSVLSSADCFSNSTNPSDWTVILGLLELNGSNPSEVSLKVTNITMSNLTGSNIVVLQLSAKPTLNNYIQPICLDFGRTFSEGSTCWTVDWSSGQGGEEQVLQQFQTSVVNCGNTSIDSICTEPFTPEQGDSGYPLMCEQGGAWFQVVVVPDAGLSIRGVNDEKTVLVKLDHFEVFLNRALVTFLSPYSTTPLSSPNSNVSTTNTTSSTNVPMTTGGSSPSCSSFFLCVHLLTFISCLQAVV